MPSCTAQSSVSNAVKTRARGSHPSEEEVRQAVETLLTNGQRVVVTSTHKLAWLARLLFSDAVVDLVHHINIALERAPTLSSCSKEHLLRSLRLASQVRSLRLELPLGNRDPDFCTEVVTSITSRQLSSLHSMTTLSHLNIHYLLRPHANPRKTRLLKSVAFRKCLRCPDFGTSVGPHLQELKAQPQCIGNLVPGSPVEKVVVCSSDASASSYLPALNDTTSAVTSATIPISRFEQDLVLGLVQNLRRLVVLNLVGTSSSSCPWWNDDGSRSPLCLQTNALLVAPAGDKAAEEELVQSWFDDHNRTPEVNLVYGSRRTVSCLARMYGFAEWRQTVRCHKGSVFVSTLVPTSTTIALMPPRKKTTNQSQRYSLRFPRLPTLPAEVLQDIFKRAVAVDDGIFQFAAMLCEVGPVARAIALPLLYKELGRGWWRFDKEEHRARFHMLFELSTCPERLSFLQKYTKVVVIDRPGEDPEDELFPEEVYSLIFSVLSGLPQLTVLEIGLPVAKVPQFLTKADNRHITTFSLILKDKYQVYNLSPKWLELPLLAQLEMLTITTLPHPSVGSFSEGSSEGLGTFASSMPALQHVFMNLETYWHPTYTAVVDIMFGPLLSQLKTIIVALPNVFAPFEFSDWLEKWNRSLPLAVSDLEKIIVLEYQPPVGTSSSPWDNKVRHLGTWYIHEVLPDMLAAAFALVPQQGLVPEHMEFIGNTARYGMDDLLDIWKWAAMAMKDRRVNTNSFNSAMVSGL
ncbi:hypothetical protein DL96DRAFT_1557530 [Flagelloscypha sp. PMI_526]|nr:hypothetical protein DL96DRAFT_1557530 [Flagelloscypha sp. PMI_526]